MTTYCSEVFAAVSKTHGRDRRVLTMFELRAHGGLTGCMETKGMRLLTLINCQENLLIILFTGGREKDDKEGVDRIWTYVDPV